jgi:ribonuclease Z
MKPSDKKPSKGISRRDVLKYSGMGLGGLAFGGALISPRARRAYAQTECPENACDYPVPDKTTWEYSYFDNLPTITPWGYEVLASGGISPTGTPLETDEMRITFLGSMVPPVRRAQQEMSVFVEVGWDDENDCPMDQFVFDCGSGVCANYGAMGIGYGRMDKIFLAHLHADHMSDLAHIYCFGPSADRKSPLYVWGPGPSGVKSPRPPSKLYNDGTKAFCEHIREAMRWHSESFSFESTSWKDAASILPTQESWGLPVKPVPVGDDPPYDGYALVPIELDWTKYGEVWGDNVAYDNPDTGVRITHFPVIHTRKGAIGYKLEWTVPGTSTVLSMIYTSDTRPETHCIEQANNVDPDTGESRGVDVFIHEMGLPQELWAMKNLGLDEPDHLNPRFDEYVKDLYEVINCSHTPPGAFGYLLSLIDPRPRLTVATHFPVADDTVECALNSVRNHVPNITWTEEYNEADDIAWSFDLMVIRVRESEPSIGRYRALVNDFGFSPVTKVYETNDPKYTNERDQQIDISTEIPPGSDTYCKTGY